MDASSRSNAALAIPAEGSPYLNRELSWLAFNSRVLEEANNPHHPLLEQLRFLAISYNNLEEFYAVRVAGLKAQLQAGVDKPSLDGLTPRQQLEAITQHTRLLLERQQRTWTRLVAMLGEEGICLLERQDLNAEEQAALQQHFSSNILPLLTPLAIDPAHPFPFLPNESMALALHLQKPGSERSTTALIPLPKEHARFVRITQGSARFIALEEVLLLCIGTLFPGHRLLGQGLFQVLRDSELDIDDEAEDLMRQFASALRRRRRSNAIQLMASQSMPGDVLRFITEQLALKAADVFVMDGLVGVGDALQLVDESRPDLKFPPYNARFPQRIRDFNGDCFAAIRHKDLLVHHPYESFDVVLQFLRQAAEDPDVLVIKQTLYRTSTNSPVVRALMEAADSGKHVIAVVELKARFDEEANMRFARALERAGVQVIFGVMDLKTHAKVSLVVRRENSHLASYVHYGTGNYHPITARIYTDLSYFTCAPSLTRDAIALFNYLTGYALPDAWEKLSIAPVTLRRDILTLLEQETANARQGKPAAVWAKMNALVDKTLIDALYCAGQAGVQIDLIIRGICCLRPGVPGLSENIRVKSVVGRFLEHSRMVAFANGHPLPSPHAKVFLSSADWMNRNCDWRVETMVPIETPTVHRQILEQIMATMLRDTAQSWQLMPDGSYVRVDSAGNRFSAHAYFMTNPSLSGAGSEKPA